MKTQYNILMVDDDEDDQLLIKDAFEDDSKLFNIQFANNGTDVLEKIPAPEFLPDLILLDLNMPKMSGFEVLRHLKGSSDYKHVPIIVFTG